ncbi:MAG TPA: polysaccharide deacetylase family protein [Chthoniobacterales bacterium]|nr:polysaccharide deacetylase family protein [Chthoniobacterales bacterium]
MTGATATSLPSIFALSAEADREALVVSVHDVAPATRAAVEKTLSDLSHHRVPVCSLLVVPNYHHHGRSTEDRGFVRWLQDLEAQGHEIVIHGYFHERPRRDGTKLSDRFLTQFYTNDEGEFHDLDYDEALRRITRAHEEFSSAGLTPRGFIAPAWLLGADAERAAVDAEMEYTTRLTGVRDLRSGDNFRARTLVYSVRSGWRRIASLAWNAALASQIADGPLARVSIHPPDRDHPEIWRQILRLTDRLVENRSPTTYRDWVAERRTRNGA